MGKTNKTAGGIFNQVRQQLKFMEFINIEKPYKVKKSFLTEYLKRFWFIPSDALQRSIEANIWDACKFKSPVLDIGIGNGEISKFIFKNHRPIDVGIDIDKSGLANAKATRKYKKVMCGDAQKMPFKDASFNTVVSNSAFEHVSDDLKAVSEVSRVLKNEGLFFLVVPDANLQYWIYEYEKDRDKSNAKDKLEKFNKRVYHLHYRSLSGWKKIFKKNNMEIVFYRYFFPKEVALLWYKIVKVFTYSFRGRELWSYLGHSKFTKFLPKKLIQLMEEIGLKKLYEKGFFSDPEEGAQLFIIARKV